MTVEHYLASLVKKNPSESNSQLVPQAYYRSKLFVTTFSSNALVAAAGPLLSLLERLCLSQSLPPVEQLRTNIEHELLAFNCKLSASQYTNSIAQIANFLMCLTIDEIIAKNYLRIYNSTAEFKAFTPLTNEDVNPQKQYFEIIDHIKERPNQYLDLIELVYYFLIAGYEGDFHQKADGRQVLDNYTEELYQIVQKNRYHKTHHLFNENPLPKIAKKNYRNTVVALVVAATVITAAFFTSHLLLENKAKAVLLGHTQLALLDN